MQKITLIGNLGADPEERFTTNDRKVISFSLAVSVKKDTTIWYQVNIWEDRIPLFSGMLEHLKKGSKVCVMGDLGAPQVYTNKQGEPAVKLYVQPFSMSFVGLVSNEKKEEKISVFDEPLPF